MTDATANDPNESLNDTPRGKPATGMKQANRIAAGIIFLFSGYIITGALAMPLSDQYGPGPGFFPLILGGLLAILSAALFIENNNPNKKDKASPFPVKQSMVSALLVMVGLVAYALVIKYLGYVLTTLVFVLFLMFVVQRDKARTAVITAVVVSAMMYLIFEVGLGVRLPKGPFGF